MAAGGLPAAIFDVIPASVDFSYFPYRVVDPDVAAIEAVEEMHPDYEYWRVATKIVRL